jgi:hypothetical protein
MQALIVSQDGSLRPLERVSHVGCYSYPHAIPAKAPEASGAIPAPHPYDLVEFEGIQIPPVTLEWLLRVREHNLTGGHMFPG